MGENKEVKEAAKELKYLTGDEAIRRKAFLREKAIKDYVTNMEGAKEEGIKQGKKEGEKNEKIEMAKKMLAEKIPIETIIKITNLKKEEIENLKKEIK